MTYEEAVHALYEEIEADHDVATMQAVDILAGGTLAAGHAAAHKCKQLEAEVETLTKGALAALVDAAGIRTKLPAIKDYAIRALELAYARTRTEAAPKTGGPTLH